MKPLRIFIDDERDFTESVVDVLKARGHRGDVIESDLRPVRTRIVSWMPVLGRRAPSSTHGSGGRVQKLLVASVVLSLGLLLPVGDAVAQGQTNKTVLTIGRATEDVRKEQRRLGPIITYLATRLKNVGIETGKVVLPKNDSILALVQYLNDGTLDIVLESAFAAQVLVNQGNAVPLLQVSREGVKDYNSYVFVRKDSGIDNMEDLKGHVIAFEDPGSTSAYFLPKAEMRVMGLDLVELQSFRSSVGMSQVGYVFAGSEINISSWVYHRKVAAGVASGIDWSQQLDYPEAHKQQFKIIFESRRVPRLFAIVRDGLDERLVLRIKEELLNMHESAEGRAAMKPFKLDRFYALPDDALKPIKALLEALDEPIR